MKKTIYLMPRRSGKSSLADYEFSKDIDNSMFIGLNEAAMGHIVSMFGNERRFFTQWSNFTGFRFKRCIIDEYMLFSLGGLKNVYDNLVLLGIEEVVVFSSRSFINKDYLSFIKACKASGRYWKDSECLLLKEGEAIKYKLSVGSYEDNKRLINDLDMLWYNFISDLDTKVIYRPVVYESFGDREVLLSDVFGTAEKD